jgi:glycosyltransferase involved in cell wall biosynthesis
MPSIAVIIPCYNEAKRLQKQEFFRWVNEQSDVHLYFINDGSTDDTNNILNGLQISVPNKIHVIHLNCNKGKGEAVRQGLLAAQEHSFDFVGYLDADLSTSTNEFYKLYQAAMEQKADMVFASRIKKLGSTIDRSAFRHITGRFIATVIDNHFKLGCYDTQCGAKVFTIAIIKEAIQQPFFTKWFFDVEIFLRIRNRNKSFKALELPLLLWQNKEGSKINLSSFPMVLKELILLSNNY